MSSEWKKLVEEAEELKSRILEDEKYRVVEGSIDRAIKVLKSVENVLVGIETLTLTEKGIQMIKSNGHLAKATKQIYTNHGTDYVETCVMLKKVCDEGRIYGSHDHFIRVRGKAHKEGVFRRIRKCRTYLWGVNPEVVEYLK